MEWLFRKLFTFGQNMYIYGGIGNIVEQNIGLTVLVVVFIFFCMSLSTIFKTLPGQGEVPAKMKLAKFGIKTLIVMFSSIVIFAVFAEYKQVEREKKPEPKSSIFSTQ